jgi:hypothetical protein
VARSFVEIGRRNADQVKDGDPPAEAKSTALAKPGAAEHAPLIER